MVNTCDPLPAAVLIGDPPALEKAFPEDLRKELSATVRLLDPPLTATSWREDPGVLAQADFALATWGVPRMDGDFLSFAPKLRAVFYAAGSVKGFVTPELFARGISVSNANKANAIPVAEYAVSAIILSLKKFWPNVRRTRRLRVWDHQLPGPGAYRSVVGLVSLGAVGRLTAEKLATYELEVLAFDPFTTQEQAEALGVRLVSLEEVFRHSDVVSLHSPWLPETVNMVHGGLLRLMKPGATLLNTSRGAVVNEDDLCAVLRERTDLTAVLDVTYPEPPRADSPLYDLDNVILTPHISGSMAGEVARMGRWMAEELERHLNGLPLQHVITEEMLATAA
ncbi:MAG: hydroxyacid dehydrogenase [Terrimicrobiaceae bacterium]